MKIHDLSQTNSILNHFLYEIREKNIQKDRMKFRRNIERIGEILSYEMSKTLDFAPQPFYTPLSPTSYNQFSNAIVVCSILRAGMPLHNGILNYFDAADSAFISASRNKTQKPESEQDFDIAIDYLSSPSLEQKTLVIADPMLATGLSMLHVLKALEHLGKPKCIHIISVVGTQIGIDLISDYLPEQSHLWIGCVDERLDEKGYIVPGLGDAGDLAFGKKL